MTDPKTQIDATWASLLEKAQKDERVVRVLESLELIEKATKPLPDDTFESPIVLPYSGAESICEVTWN
jgi:hypothetical protein